MKIVYVAQYNRLLLQANLKKVAHRKELEGRITSNGGEYKGNLTKDITHLIAKAPCGTKYTYAGEWGIKIVSVEWLEQSVERGMILDEKLYSLMLPPEERGQNAWIRRTASSASLGKRARAEESGPKRSRKLRRTASAKLSSQNIGLWTDIVSGPAEVEDNKPSEWDDKQKDCNPKIKVETSDRPGPRNETVKESPASEIFDEKTARTSSSFSPAGIGRKVGLFRGHRFFMYGFSERQVCKTVVKFISASSFPAEFNSTRPLAFSSGRDCGHYGRIVYAIYNESRIRISARTSQYYLQRHSQTTSRHHEACHCYRYVGRAMLASLRFGPTGS